MLTGCNTQDNSQNISKDKVQNTKEAFTKVTLRMNSAIENFKAEQAKLIETNNKRIAEYKLELARENAKNKAILENKLSELEHKNIKLKKRLVDYKNNGNQKWVAFRDEFNHDMEELGKALSDLTIKNVY